MTRRNLDWALEYAERGWHVFPCHYVLKDKQCSCRIKDCKRIGKHPVTRNGLKDATTDAGQIRRWWGEGPHYNIGISTGASGLVVIDVDTDAAKGKKGAESFAELIEQYGTPEPTLQQSTGSGGTHYIYSDGGRAYKNDAKGKYLGKDIDVRAAGGYIIVPPSNHYTGGRYAWANDLPVAQLPQWVADLLEQVDASPDASAAKASRASVDATKDAAQAFDKEALSLSPDDVSKMIAVIPSDDRDVWWKVGAALKTAFGDERGFDIWDEWSQQSEKYDAVVTRKQWRSFREGDITLGTVVHYAKENGWKGFDKEAADSPQFKENWVYVVDIKRFVETSTLRELDKEQFNAQFAPAFKKGLASDHVLRNEAFPRLDAITFWPNHEKVVTEGGLRKLNLWLPSGVVPHRGDVSVLLNHISYLFPEPDEQDIILDYIAFQVQKPGEKVHWAPIIQGVPGTGKSFLGQVVSSVVGPHNVSFINSETLHETFTGWQKRTQFVVVEEMMARGRLELMNKLKPMITEPLASIREMYKPPYTQPNRFNFLFLTNHEDAVIIDKTDRRYCVLYSPAPPNSPEYYGELFGWMRSNAGAMLNYFQGRDLSDFNPKAHAPMTDGKKVLIEESMLPLDSWVDGQVRDKVWPFNVDLVSPSDLCASLPDFGLRANPKEVGKTFSRLGYRQLCRRNNSRIWSVRNHDRYSSLCTSQVYEYFLKQASLAPTEEDGSPSDAAIIAAAKVNMVKQTKPM